MSPAKIWVVFHLTKANFVDQQIDGGYSVTKDGIIKVCYTNKDLADNAAKDLAKKNPGNIYVVLGPEDYFEAITPKVVNKQFNARGEFGVVE